MGKSLLKTILVCVNGTTESLHAAMYGIILAKQLGLSLKVVYVVDTATIKLLANSKFFAPYEQDEYEKNLNKDGKNILDYIKNLAAMKGIKAETELRSGAVATEILLSADELKADMILVGGRRQNSHPLKQTEIQITRTQSTTEIHLTQYSTCPVLVVNKKDMDALFKVS